MAPRKRMHRRRRVNKRKAAARKRVVVNKALQPIAQRYICKMKYCEAFSLNTSGSTTGVVAYRFRLNSVQDPNLTSGGHRPYGYDQLLGIPGVAQQGLYNRYRVISCHYAITAAPAAGQTVQLTALPANEAVSTGITNGAALRENPRSRYIAQTSQAPLKVLKGKVYLPSLVGRNKQQYMADDRFQADYASNPLEAAILNVYLNEHGDSSGLVLPVEARISIVLTYTVELFDVVNKPQSAQAP